jgi:glyoxylase-like metal-dependent hydrolase (beta-lactamase superfamily II)
MTSKPSTPLRHLTRALALALLGATAGTGFLATTAQAAAPMVKKSAPGFYRMMLGDFEVTALSDGTVELPVNKILTNIKAAKVDLALAKYSLKSPLETSVNAYLINTGEKLVLIDTGAAKLFGPTLGNLQESIKAAGYTPEQVDEIYITHMHADHVGGLMTGDKMAFPNAIVRSDKKDADFWLSKENLDKAPEANKGFFQGAQASVNPYVSAGKYKPFEGNTDLVPGIKAVVTRGHTPGHAVYVVESKGQKMMVLGDLMHVAAVQFAQPSVAIVFDGDSKTAIAERKRIYANAAKEHYLFAVAHISFPGIGRVRTDGAGYAWMPVNYSVVK